MLALLPLWYGPHPQRFHTLADGDAHLTKLEPLHEAPPTGRVDVVRERPAAPLKFVAESNPSGPLEYVMPETDVGFSEDESAEEPKYVKEGAGRALERAP